MHPRLDPTCEEAQALHARHRQRETLLVGDAQSQLASVVRMTHEKQVDVHRAACARCRDHRAGCPACGFDTRTQRHGWMCPEQPSRWRDALPWNWRPRHAPPAPQPRAVPVRAAAPPRPLEAARVPTPGGGSVAHRAASSAPKPRPKPATTRPDALQLAYQALGVPPGASEDDVRAAYRAKAQQYHPDKVATLAPEFRALADQKMKELNAAYERVKRAR